MGKRILPAIRRSRIDTQIAIDVENRKRERAKYEAAVEEYKNSEKGQREVKLRAMAQAASNSESEINVQLMNIMTELKDKIVASYVQDLGYDKEPKAVVSNERFKNLYSQYYIPIERLRTMNAKYGLTISRSSKKTVYDLMFVELMDLDIRFSLFASREALVRSNIKFHLLPDELKSEMIEHFNEVVDKVEDRRTFMKYYGKYFKKPETVEL